MYRTYLHALCAISVISGVDSRKNVLFLVSDDMRPQFTFFGKEYLPPGHPHIHAPNLESLANTSMVFQRAYVQYALCNPSRGSFLTGRRPDTTHVYDLDKYFREVGGNFTTIPQYFKENGYRTIGMGKIFHDGNISNNDDPVSWTDEYYHAPNNDYYYTLQRSWFSVAKEQFKYKPLPDEQIANRAVSTLRSLASETRLGKNFFLAVGFYKPHLPFVFPESMFAHYPYSSIRPPKNPYPPVNLPEVAWNDNYELIRYHDITALNVTVDMNTTLPPEVVHDLRRAYYSSVSWADQQVGRVLRELDDLGLRNKTIVVFLSDHGFQLGDHNEWCKQTNFDIATRAPLMIRIPGLTDDGMATEKLIEFVDIFPTLVEAVGLKPFELCPDDSRSITKCWEGTSLMPLIKNPQAQWKSAAFSQYQRSASVMGYTMKTEKYRYTEWVHFSGPPEYKPNWSINFGTELYDHGTDLEETRNLAADPKYAMLVKMLSQKLHSGWREVIQDTTYTISVAYLAAVSSLCAFDLFILYSIC